MNLLPGISTAEIEYGTDTTRAIVRMVYSGAVEALSQYPHDLLARRGHHALSLSDVSWTVFLALAAATETGPRPLDFQAEVSTFYYDTAQTFHPVPMTALRHVVPMSQILFGTDYPYRSSQENTEGLMASGVFDAKELQAIKSENALRLLPRMRPAA